MQVCKTVKLRMRDRRNGTKSLFLDFWPGYRDPETMELIRRRSLGMYIYADPANKQQKLYNDKILAKAEAIRCKVYIDVLDEKYDFFNPKFGFNYEINTNNKVYISYAIAHKEPVRNNYEAWNAGSEKPKAERLNDLELGYKYQSSKFSAGANFYYMNYKNQFVLTGELNSIGEAVTRNLEKTYRMGVELEAAWKPVSWFQWDANATWSKNRAKDMMVTLEDGETKASLGETPLSFSPDFIFNNILTFQYAGFKGAIQSQYVSDQYLTNTGFKEMMCQDENGNTTYETLLLKKHFTTNIDLSYHFSLKKLGMKDATVGVTLYNIFDSLYDNNGWAAPQYRMADGKLIAVNTWNVRDMDAAGFAPSAPFNCMAHLSINF